MTGSMKHSIVYAPAQKNFNVANVVDTTKTSKFLKIAAAVYVISGD